MNNRTNPVLQSSLGFKELLVVVCFVLSGLSALMYQTAWMRMFAVTFGTSELAIASILAAYMGGLAAGSRLSGYLADKIKAPILWYAGLEFGIAATALMVPYFMKLGADLYISILGLQDQPVSSEGWMQTCFYLLMTFLIVGLPTLFMGATLPILARHLIHTKSQIGARIGLLYFANTLGAVAGVVLSAFILMPIMGLKSITYLAVMLNIVIFFLAVWMSRIKLENSNETSQPASFFVGDDNHSAFVWKKGFWISQAGWVLPVIAVSGGVSFLYEVLWTRMLGHVVGGSVTAFATMLGTFLAGIALGSAVAGALVKRFGRSDLQLCFCQIMIATMSIFSFNALEFWVAQSQGSLGAVVMSMVVLLPSALFIGATFPLAVHALVRSERHVGEITARVYAWNTVGAIVGAIATGFVLLPRLGFERTLFIAVALNFVLAVWLILFVVRFQTRLAIPVLMGFLILVFF